RPRLRPYARDERRSFPRGRAVRGRARSSRRSPRAEGALPHPLLGHRLRQPQRDEASALRRGDAPRRSAWKGAPPLQAPGHGHLRVAGPEVDSGDLRSALSFRENVLAARLELSGLVLAASLGQELSEYLECVALTRAVLSGGDRLPRLP